VGRRLRDSSVAQGGVAQRFSEMAAEHLIISRLHSSRKIMSPLRLVVAKSATL
jgi:hypothetical protein